MTTEPVAESSAAGPEAADDEAVAAAVVAAGEPVEAAGPGRLEEEGDVAADYLEELLDIADIDGDIDIEVRHGRTYISVVAEEGDATGLRALVGEDGAVLEALQELTRLSVLTATDSRSRLVLDITGYRKERSSELQIIAEQAVSQAKEGGQDVALRPMSAYERKIVHDAVAELGLVSESEGEGEERHIVVSMPAS